MKEIIPELNGLNLGEMMDLKLKQKKAKLHKKRIFCGMYRMNPLYATENGFILQIPDDEPDYLNKKNENELKQN